MRRRRKPTRLRLATVYMAKTPPMPTPYVQKATPAYVGAAAGAATGAIRRQDGQATYAKATSTTMSAKMAYLR